MESQDEKMPNIQPYWMRVKEPREFKIKKKDPARHRMADLVASLTGREFRSGEKSENLVNRKMDLFKSNKRSSSFAHINMMKSGMKPSLSKRKALPGMIRSFNQTENVVKKHRANQVRAITLFLSLRKKS